MVNTKSIKIGTIIAPLTIETLVNGGNGLARYDGRVVFIPNATVGDIVSCRVNKVKKKFATADIVEIIHPSQVRQQAECNVADSCGGCQWQHLPYTEQLRWKEQLFRDSLIHTLQIDPDKILPIVAAPDEWRYRSRVQVKCSNTKTEFIVGFYRIQSHFVVATKNCLLIQPQLNDLLQQLKQLIDQTPFANDIHQLDLAIDDNEKKVAVIHYNGRDQAELVELLTAVDISADLLLKSKHKKQSKIIKGNGILTIKVDHPEMSLQYLAGNFAQINLGQNRVLVNKVIALAELTYEHRVLDLYCGMGNFSLPLARRAKEVIGIEESSGSIDSAKKNRLNNKITNVEFSNKSAIGALKSHALDANPIDLLLLDPPRIGAQEIMNELIEAPVKKVIYVSCDPQTLCRDLKILVDGGYQLISSQPLDMFPQTHHCESVTMLHYCSK